jgi:hypothetical protein
LSVVDLKARRKGKLTMKKYLSGGACTAIVGAAMLLSFAATPAEAQAPGGSYLQSCRDVRAHGDRVKRHAGVFW